MDEGLAQLRQAESLEPLSLPTRNDFARALYRARRYDDAIQESQRILDLDPSFSNAFATLTYAYEQKHEYAQAVKADLQVLHLAGRSEEDTQALQRTFEASGWQAYWAQELELFQRKSSAPVTSYVLAETCLRMGNREQALHLLEGSFAERGDAPLLIGVEPLFDPLRSDRRFIDLMQRVGLPQGDQNVYHP
jgi:tetratricopeptide (TPR) repeat protein